MSFALAVLQPFAKGAEGARVPDEYSFPTETKCFKYKYVMTAPVDNVGLNLILRASLTETLIMNDNAGSTTISQPDLGYSDRSQDGVFDAAGNRRAVPFQNGLYTTGFASHSGFNTGNSNNWNRYRIVGVGMRCTSLMRPETAEGYFGFYTSPMEDMNHFYMWRILQQNTGYAMNTDGTTLKLKGAGIDYHGVLQKTNANDVTPGSYNTTAGSNSLWSKNFQLLIQATGIPWTEPTGANQIIIDTNVTETPTGAMMNHLNFQKHGWQTALRPVTMDAWKWRKFEQQNVFRTTDTSGTGYLVGGQSLTRVKPAGNPSVNTLDGLTATGWTQYSNTGSAASSGAGVGGGLADYDATGYTVETECIQQSGWTQVAVIGRGLPAGTFTTTQTLPMGAQPTDIPAIGMVEIIMHVEFINGSIEQTSNAQVCPINENAMKQTLSAASKMPLYNYIFEESVARQNKKVRVSRGYI